MRQGAPELGGPAICSARSRSRRRTRRRADVLLELGAAEQAAGLPTAPDRLREAIALIGEPLDRAREALAPGHPLSERLRWRERPTSRARRWPTWRAATGSSS